MTRPAESSDAVVIGGGITGLFTALALAETGMKKVLVLEKRGIGAGSSGKSGAILRQHYSHETTIRMARESLVVYRALAERSGQDIGFRQTGMVFLCHEADRETLARNVELQRSVGVAVELLDAASLRELEPGVQLGDETIGAFESEAGFVDPGRTLFAVAELAKRHGVVIREGVRVVDVALDAGRVTGVRTETGDAIATPVVINAGGPWASILCRRLGLDLPLTAVRPEQAFFMPQMPEMGTRRIFCDLMTGVYWKPEPAGWTRVGLMSYDDDEVVPDPDAYDEGVSSAFIQNCRRHLTERLPDYAKAISWGGGGALYTITPDAHALIGAVDAIPGFYVASGFSGHGFKMGPAVGRGLATLILGSGGTAGGLTAGGMTAGVRTDGEREAFDPAFFAVDRFATGRTQTTSYRYRILG